MDTVVACAAKEQETINGLTETAIGKADGTNGIGLEKREGTKVPDMSEACQHDITLSG